jgi:hypothetical protein
MDNILKERAQKVSIIIAIPQINVKYTSKGDRKLVRERKFDLLVVT